VRVGRGLATAGDRVWVAAGSGAAAWLAVPAGIDVLAGVVSPCRRLRQTGKQPQRSVLR